MATRRNQETSSPAPRRRAATTPEAMENRLILAAAELAEKQLHEGTASAQVITHFLKLGSSRERLEQQKIAHENELLAVKREAIESQKRIEELYTEALNAMRSYRGEEPLDIEGNFTDED